MAEALAKEQKEKRELQADIKKLKERWHIPTWVRDAAYNGLVQLHEQISRHGADFRKRDLLLALLTANQLVKYVDKGAMRRVAYSVVSGIAVLVHDAVQRITPASVGRICQAVSQTLTAVSMLVISLSDAVSKLFRALIPSTARANEQVWTATPQSSDSRSGHTGGTSQPPPAGSGPMGGGSQPPPPPAVPAATTPHDPHDNVVVPSGSTVTYSNGDEIVFDQHGVVSDHGVPTPPLPPIIIDNGVAINEASPFAPPVVYIPSRLNPASNGRSGLSTIPESPVNDGSHHLIFMLSDSADRLGQLGQIEERVVAALRKSPIPNSAVLMDGGATCGIRTSTRGIIPNTWRRPMGSLAVGDSGAKLVSHGSYLYAETRIGADGMEQDLVHRCEYTPTGIANIDSEGVEVEKLGSTLMWVPGQSRQFKLRDGRILKCHMTGNLLSWLKVKPIDDTDRLYDAIKEYRRANGIGSLGTRLVDCGSEDLPPQPEHSSAVVARPARPAEERKFDSRDDVAMRLEFKKRSAHIREGEQAQQSTPASQGCGNAGGDQSAAGGKSISKRPLSSTGSGDDSDDGQPYNISYAPFDGAFIIADDLIDACMGREIDLAAGGAIFPSVADPLAPTSMSRPPKLTGLEILLRTHVVLGHPGLAMLLRTLSVADGMKAGVITKADVEAFVRHGCGICDLVKRQRPAFKSVTDKTIPPVGKVWVLDSLKLRTPSLLGNSVLHRFVCKASRKRRSFGTKGETSAEITGAIDRMRAFNRPVHGEMMVVKHDQHPAMESHEFQTYTGGEQLLDASSSPYVHENVGEIEVYNKHDIDTAVAMLRQSKSSEGHAETAIYMAEDVGCMLVTTSGKSADMIYFGRDVDPIKHVLAYGSPVKALVHPEIRGSKFEDRAVSGTYRGFSRESFSDRACWVFTGQGSTGRHVTVDLGCVKVDERSVINRSNRNHVDHNPDALDPVPDDAVPANAQWTDPSAESLERRIWTVAMPPPTLPFVLNILGGEFRPDDLQNAVSLLTSGKVLVVTIDKYEVGGYEHDITDDAVNGGLCELAKHQLCIAVFAQFECAKWSALRFLQDPPGPPILFDIDNLCGRKDADGVVLKEASDATRLIDSGLQILRAARAVQPPKPILLEGPVEVGKNASYRFRMKGCEQHVCYYSYPPMSEFIKEQQMVSIKADQCGKGWDNDVRKPTDFRATKELEAKARSECGTKVCTHAKHMGTMIGTGQDGKYVSRDKKTYNGKMVISFAKVLLSPYPEFVEPLPVAAKPDQHRTQPTGEAAKDVDASPPEPASRARPRREASDAKYTKDGQLISAVMCERAGDGDSVRVDDGADGAAANEGVGRTVQLGRQQMIMAACKADDLATDLYVDSMETILINQQYFDIDGLEIVSSKHMVALLGDDEFDVILPAANESRDGINDWHTPRTEFEYLRSPQRAHWRNARELKMDEYNKLNMHRPHRIKDVLAQGHKIMGSLWAHRLKPYKTKFTDMFNVRWCIKGTGMDRDVYESFHDVMRATSLWIMANIAAHYNVIDVQFDVGNAFQAARRDTSSAHGKPLPKLFAHYPPGFQEVDADGNKMCAEVLSAHQGTIDAANIFGKQFESDLKDAKFRSMVWDPKLYVLYYGPPVPSAYSLEKVLAMVANRPPVDGVPCGWAIIGRHVDDGVGLVSGPAIQRWIEEKLGVNWTITWGPWKRVLGADCTRGDDWVEFSADALIDSLVREHLLSIKVTPNMPYTQGISSVGPGQRPAAGTVEEQEFDIMQTKHRSLVGSLVWLCNYYVTQLYPTNFLGALNANPSAECYKHNQYQLMYLSTHRYPRRVGGHGKVPLESLEVDAVPKPFAGGAARCTYLGLHAFADANLAKPAELHHQSTNKSITGGCIMLGGCILDAMCLRQHLAAPDAHTAEVHAASTVQHRIAPLRGVLQEALIPQPHATPIYLDSSSTIFAGNDSGSVRRSVWTLRRVDVLKDGILHADVATVHIPECDNVADGFAKALKSVKSWFKHMTYLLNRVVGGAAA